MNGLRQQLRRAAQDFADNLYELLLGGLPRELGAARFEATPRSRPRSTSRTTQRRRPHSDASLERVPVYVTEHPGARPKDIAEGTGVTDRRHRDTSRA